MSWRGLTALLVSIALLQGSPTAAANDGTLVVQRFEFTGNTVYTAEQLSGITKPYTGRPVALADLYEAADKVTAFYAANGYTLATVTVPAQSVAGGIVKLEVLEGRIGQVVLEGNRRYTIEQLSSYLPGVATGQVYHGATLEQGLDRLSHLPGLPRARAVLRPGAEYGTSEVLIQAHEELFNASLALDNHGRAALGETRTSLTASVNNPLRFADELQALYLRSNSGLLEYGSLSYGLAAGRNLRVTAGYGEARFDTTIVGITGLTVEGQNRSARVGLEWPLARTRASETTVIATASNTEATADLQGISISAVKLPLLELSLRQKHTTDDKAVTQFVTTVASSFGSACETSPGCESQPVRLELDAQRLQPIVGRLDGYLRVNAVYSPDPLPELTQTALGGPNNVRAYPASEVRGDLGAFASAGLRRSFNAGPVALQARVFGDAGEVSAQSPYGTHASLSGVGIGFDAYWTAQSFSLSARVDGSVPTGGREASDGSDGRVFGSLSVNF